MAFTEAESTLFRQRATFWNALAGLADAYGCDLDFESTMPLLERHDLVF